MHLIIIILKTHSRRLLSGLALLIETHPILIIVTTPRISLFFEEELNAFSESRFYYFESEAGV